MAQQSKEVLLRFIFDSKGAITNAKELEEELKKIGLTSGKVKSSLGDLNKEQAQVGKIAGTAGATVTEFGRLLSDLPYGIQGVANNLSQLASMFSLTVASAQKVNNGLSVGRNVFNELKNVILGPVGVLVAFQGLVALLEIFTKKQKDATDSVSDFNKEIQSQILALDQLLASFNISELVEKFDLLKEEDPFGNFTDSAKKDFDSLIEFLAFKSKEFENALKNLTPEEREDRQVLRGLLEEFQNILSLRQKISEINKKIADEDTEEDERRLLRIDLLATEMGLMNAIKKFDPDYKKNRKEEQDLLAGTVDYYEHHIKLLTKERDAVARSGEEIDNYNEKIKEFQDALNFLLLAREQNKVEVVLQTMGIADVSKEDVAERIAEGIPTPEEIAETLKAKMAGEESAAFLEKFLGLKESAEKTIETAQKIGEGLSILGDFFDASSERDIAREKNKTTKINNELRDRLKNENLSASERERINKRIAVNEFNLDKRLDKIREKQFKQQKAFKIAVALADTASMAAKAYLSQLSVPTPDAVVRANVAAGIAAAFGLVQVAAIAKQKYVAGQTSVAGLGGGGAPGGTPGGGGAPSFNVVGASQLNQVAAAVAGQREDPIRAYVVASDVSTAQELDRNILSQASIG